MLILDTDHMSALDRGWPIGVALRTRLEAGSVPFGTTVVTCEELLRGRLAQLARCKDLDQLATLYDRLQERIRSLAPWLTLPWDANAAGILRQLQERRINIGTMDLRIASIVIANGATLLSRNLRDFERVPNLLVEDWLP